MQKTLLQRWVENIPMLKIWCGIGFWSQSFVARFVICDIPAYPNPFYPKNSLPNP
jgi:hypothetical protein